MARPARGFVKRLVILLGALSGLLLVVVVARTLLVDEGAPAAFERIAVPVDTAAAVRNLSKAITFRTVSTQEAVPDTNAFLSIHRFLAETYPRTHVALTRETVSALSLLYSWEGSDAALRPAIFMSHLDVVPAGDDEDLASWTHPPFEGAVDAGHVWGRGALDDKIGVIAILEAVELLVRRGFRPRRTIHLAFGHDEEVGGPNGAAKIAEVLASRRPDGPAFVIDEGGVVAEGVVADVSHPVALIGVAEKGYLSLRLTSAAEGGHSSAPPATTAIGRLSRAITRLEADPFPARLDGPTEAMFRRIGPNGPLLYRVAAANMWLFRPLVKRMMLKEAATASMVRTTTAPTMLQAGVKENALPGAAAAVVNFRIMPGETTRSVEDRVRRVVADTLVDIRPINVYFEPSPVADTDGPAFRILARTLRETTPSSEVIIAPYLVPGATDSRYFSRFTRNVFRFIPVTLRDTDLARIHGVDERVRIEGLAAAVAFFHRLIENVSDADF